MASHRRGVRTSGIILCAAFLFGCDDAPAPEKLVVRPVVALKVNDNTVLQQRAFVGRAKASRELELAFNVAGPLIEFGRKVGDQVAKGDLLGRIDPDIFAAEVARAKAALQRAEATEKNATLQRKRQEALLKRGTIAAARLDRFIAAADRAIADIATMKAALSRAQLDLSYSYLRAPFDGIVVQTYVNNFENIRAKQPVIRIVGSSRLEMVVDIPENLISLVDRSAEVHVVFDQFPDHKISAKISEVGTEASETTRTFPVTLTMEQQQEFKILPGMVGRARGRTKSSDALRSGTLEIPNTATFTLGSDGATFVWTIDDESKIVSKREVKTGLLTDTGVQILHGLKSGEWIAVAGVHFLKDGQQVRIMQR
jgi:RND family efflux transporter MFP subunit